MICSFYYEKLWLNAEKYNLWKTVIKCSLLDSSIRCFHEMMLVLYTHYTMLHNVLIWCYSEVYQHRPNVFLWFQASFVHLSYHASKCVSVSLCLNVHDCMVHAVWCASNSMHGFIVVLYSYLTCSIIMPFLGIGHDLSLFHLFHSNWTFADKATHPEFSPIEARTYDFWITGCLISLRCPRLNHQTDKKQL